MAPRWHAAAQPSSRRQSRASTSFRTVVIVGCCPPRSGAVERSSGSHRSARRGLVSEALGADGAFVERFEREARLVGAVNHPNVVASTTSFCKTESRTSSPRCSRERPPGRGSGRVPYRWRPPSSGPSDGRGPSQCASRKSSGEVAAFAQVGEEPWALGPPWGLWSTRERLRPMPGPSSDCSRARPRKPAALLTDPRPVS
jgi:hypothetical protein